MNQVISVPDTHTIKSETVKSELPVESSQERSLSRSPLIKQEHLKQIDRDSPLPVTPQAPLHPSQTKSPGNVLDSKTWAEARDAREGQEDDSPRDSQDMYTQPADTQEGKETEDGEKPIEGDEDGEILEAPPEPVIDFLATSPSKKILKRKFTGCVDISDYVQDRKIGEGTFGTVTIGYTKSKEQVALKKIILHNEGEGMPVTAVREIKILKRLNHMNVVQFKEMAYQRGDLKTKTRGHMFMVFGYMDHDLAGILENEQIQLKPAQIKSYTKQMLQGLEYLHENRILHRDMKSANLLVNNTGRLKIADFGLARTMSTQQNARYTNLVVTRWYRPPEILMGSSQYDTSVDIWGAGCIFGEMLKRRPIMAGSSDAEQLEKILLLCGTPTEKSWPDYRKMPMFKNGPFSDFQASYSRRMSEKFPQNQFDKATVVFLDHLLELNPDNRPSATRALRHVYFRTEPLAAEPNTADFTPFPSSHELAAREAREQKAKLSKIPGGYRPCLPCHFDALPAINGSYYPPRELAETLDFDKYENKSRRNSKRSSRSRERSRERSRGYSKPRSYDNHDDRHDRKDGYSNKRDYSSSRDSHNDRRYDSKRDNNW